MIHAPRRKSAKELIEQRGFVVAKIGVGYEKIVPLPKDRKGKFDRLHATIHHGYINLHWDEEVPGKKHEVRAGNHYVRGEIAEIKKIDVNGWDKVINSVRNVLHFIFVI